MLLKGRIVAQLKRIRFGGLILGYGRTVGCKLKRKRDDEKTVVEALLFERNVPK